MTLTTRVVRNSGSVLSRRGK